jgi:hypothetical protein
MTQFAHRDEAAFVFVDLAKDRSQVLPFVLHQLLGG